MLFVGWEGVGLCSYLLIGYDYHKKAAADAGKKAFVVNRIGDFGFILGIFGVFALFGSLDFGTVFGPAAREPERFVAVHDPRLPAPLRRGLRQVGAVPAPRLAARRDGGADARLRADPRGHDGHGGGLHGRSLQRLLPALARRHARRGGRGGFTALFAATIGLAQNDIKKVLAYSTVSQLGYMFLACGVGAFTAGMFHVMTHAFFKACLFLGSGSVIHALGGEQDIRRMGGLALEDPHDLRTFLVATLAIAGVPLFAGFFSKDAILAARVRGRVPRPCPGSARSSGGRRSSRRA